MSTQDPTTFHHHKYLGLVAEEDVRFILEKDRSYGASWKKSGGRSAWFMLRRKMDRMEVLMRRPDWPESFSMEDLKEVISGDGEVSVTSAEADWLLREMAAEDIFMSIEAGPGGEDGTVLAEVRDLRRYLLLVEAEMIARGVVALDPRPPGGSALDGIDLQSGDRIVVGDHPAVIVPVAAVPVEDSNRHAEREDQTFGFALTPEDWERLPRDERVAYDRYARDAFRLRDMFAEGVVHGRFHRAIRHPRLASATYWAVQRDRVWSSQLDMLERFPVELNDKEWGDSPSPVQCLYDWDGKKWAMRPEYLEHWGRKS